MRGVDVGAIPGGGGRVGDADGAVDGRVPETLGADGGLGAFGMLGGGGMVGRKALRAITQNTTAKAELRLVCRAV
jgi:hypothetical protein